MDQMLPLPSQELPSPKSVESKPSSGNEEYHVPMPEIGNHHDSQERVNQATSAVTQATDDAAVVAAADDDQGSSIPAPVNDDFSSANPDEAKDDNLIEKEWVQNAKKIVHETKHDPQDQASKIGRFKKDYIKKRFGKDIKLPEESSL
jgi:hypothetical protein